MDYEFLLDIVQIIAGGYLIYVALRMKQTNEVFHNALMSKTLDLNKAPDPQGYIKTIFPVNIIAGSILLICGIVSRVTVNSDNYRSIVSVTMFLVAACIIFYGYFLMWAQKKFLTQ